VLASVIGAYGDLLRNKMRGHLTVLGITIGVALSLIGEDRVQRQMSNLGGNYVWGPGGRASLACTLVRIRPRLCRIPVPVSEKLKMIRPIAILPSVPGYRRPSVPGRCGA
jgi:hypothetical protein